ncbi:hypothetical protein JNW91_16815 [Micromonospora sp. STR1_7]|uniref:Uncharacterized protein n=1 Tax=Micromonospora parastrephiae TaxID=2806101 RepID=A0ABS1XVR6_9ACTN|nr:hypothetical protein [Micromonospora parastrephiae]MBM0233371.1 hypothetical protein [Micromonospora parastrephiae]
MSKPDTTTPSPRHFRAVKANAVRYGDQAAAERADRELRAAKLERAIRTAVDAAPPLTDEQRARLAGLLAPPQASGGGGQVAA